MKACEADQDAVLAYSNWVQINEGGSPNHVRFNEAMGWVYSDEQIGSRTYLRSHAMRSGRQIFHGSSRGDRRTQDRRDDNRRCCGDLSELRQRWRSSSVSIAPDQRRRIMLPPWATREKPGVANSGSTNEVTPGQAP